MLPDWVGQNGLVNSIKRGRCNPISVHVRDDLLHVYLSPPPLTRGKDRDPILRIGKPELCRDVALSPRPKLEPGAGICCATTVGRPVSEVLCRCRET